MAYTDLTGSKVTITYKDGAGVTVATGTLKAATPDGVQFQPKGGKSILLLNHEITSVDPVETPVRAASAPAEIKAKRVDPVTEGTVKRHLAHVHGLLLSAVNKLSPDEAMVVHNDHHERHGDDASHYHAEKPVKDEAQAE